MRAIEAIRLANRQAIASYCVLDTCASRRRFGVRLAWLAVSVAIRWKRRRVTGDGVVSVIEMQCSAGTLSGEGASSN